MEIDLVKNSFTKQHFFTIKNIKIPELETNSIA